jgi:hypothetical protein
MTKIKIFCITLSGLSLFAMGCASHGDKPNASHKDLMPVHLGTENLSYDAKNMVTNALADYNLVSKGHLPIHAKADLSKKPTPENCSVDYRGEGYNLRIFCSSATIGDASGFYYGPVLTFNKYSSASSRAAAISNVQFYTPMEIRKIRVK